MYNFPQILRDNWKKLHINILFQLTSLFHSIHQKKKNHTIFFKFSDIPIKSTFSIHQKNFQILKNIHERLSFNESTFSLKFHLLTT